MANFWSGPMFMATKLWPIFGCIMRRLLTLNDIMTSCMNCTFTMVELMQQFDNDNPMTYERIKQSLAIVVHLEVMGMPVSGKTSMDRVWPPML